VATLASANGVLAMPQGLLIALAVCISSLSTAQNFGRIAGTVVDEQWQVVDGATVCLAESSGNSSAINCRTPTEHGQFQIPELRFGTYGIFAINEAEGYSIGNQSPGDEVTISAANPAPEITVRLRPGGAVLSGIVRDKINGKPVNGITVQYLDIDGKASGSSLLPSDGEFHVTLPPECDLVIIISAKGYKGWVYTDSSSPRPVLRLGAGERKQVDVQLEPIARE
jgi:hypothetical protein